MIVICFFLDVGCGGDSAGTRIFIKVGSYIFFGINIFEFMFTTSENIYF